MSTLETQISEQNLSSNTHLIDLLALDPTVRTYDYKGSRTLASQKVFTSEPNVSIPAGDYLALSLTLIGVVLGAGLRNIRNRQDYM